MRILIRDLFCFLVLPIALFDVMIDPVLHQVLLFFSIYVVFVNQIHFLSLGVAKEVQP